MKKNLLLILCLSIAAILPGCHGDKTETRTTTRMTRGDGGNKTMRKETTTRRERKKMKREDRTRDEGKNKKRMYKKTETRREMSN